MRPRARAPTCPLATLLSFFPVSRFAPPSPTVRTSLLLSDDVCRRCNLACDRLFTLVVKFLHAPFWRPCTLAPGDICTPLPPLRYASAVKSKNKSDTSIQNFSQLFQQHFRQVVKKSITVVNVRQDHGMYQFNF